MEQTVKIKICGLMSLEDVAAVNAAKPDYAGFVLAKSRRRISREHARLLRMEPVSYTHLTLPTIRLV